MGWRLQPGSIAVDGHHLVEEHRQVGAAEPPLRPSGGLAPVVIPESETVTVHRPDLTLQGLRLVYDKNV